mmetsp:Transcript_49549/g.152941  ORF Transcript_49549/g.152941 Transcript_49549/m.152941 type:complete len:329 (+) Transcript_49549:382-1368(+)
MLLDDGLLIAVQAGEQLFHSCHDGPEDALSADALVTQRLALLLFVTKLFFKLSESVSAIFVCIRTESHSVDLIEVLAALLLKSFDFTAQIVHVREQAVVGLFRLQKLVHDSIQVVDRGHLTNFVERVFVLLHLRRCRVFGECVGFCVRASLLRCQLGLARGRRLVSETILLFQRSQPRFDLLFHFAVLFQEFIELLESLGEAVHFFCREGFEVAQHLNVVVALFVGDVGNFDDECHFLLLVLKIRLQLQVDFIEDFTFPAKSVDLVAQLLVAAQHFVEAHETLIKSVLKNFDLLPNRVVRLLGNVHSSSLPAASTQVGAYRRDSIVDC